MSWYFFGGFSAYAMVPSARVVNHSGCSVTHGWSGGALQREVQRDLEPEPLGRATKASKSSMVPRSGWIASWPPAGSRWRTASPGPPGRRRACCSGPCGSPLEPDRVDRREVDDVEAHRGDGGQPLGRGAQRAGGPAVLLLVVPSQPSLRGKNSYHAPDSASSRSTTQRQLGRRADDPSRSGCADQDVGNRGGSGARTRVARRRMPWRSRRPRMPAGEHRPWRHGARDLSSLAGALQQPVRPPRASARRRRRPAP
jgi:hypothetical protein